MDDYMDDIAHDSHPLGQVSRKRKADGDDPASQDCQPPEPMAVDPTDGLPPIPRHRQWSASSEGHISPTFLGESDPPAPTCRSREPKRPKIQVATGSSTDSSPQQGRKGTPSSPHRKGGRADDSPHGHLESITTRSDSPKSRRHQKASALSSIDLDSPYIPPFLPIPNRETLKELELEAVLCNPQLRESFESLPTEQNIHHQPPSVQLRNETTSLRSRFAIRLRTPVPPHIKSPEARSGRTLLDCYRSRARMSLYMHHMERTRSHLGRAGVHLQRLPFSTHPQHSRHPPEFSRQDVTNSFEDS